MTSGKLEETDHSKSDSEKEKIITISLTLSMKSLRFQTDSQHLALAPIVASINSENLVSCDTRLLGKQILVSALMRIII